MYGRQYYSSSNESSLLTCALILRCELFWCTKSNFLKGKSIYMLTLHSITTVGYSRRIGNPKYILLSTIFAILQVLQCLFYTC